MGWDGETGEVDARRIPRPVGANLFGFFRGNLGLGVSARYVSATLAARGVPQRVTDIALPARRLAERGPSVARRLDPRRVTYSHSIFLLNPPILRGRLYEHPWWALSDRINATLPFWELPRLPDDWCEPLSWMDVVLTPTQFVRDAVTRSADVVTIACPQGVSIPSDVRPERERWGFAPGRTAFVTTFDLASSLTRKNPLDTITAFKAAFPGRDDVQLVVKANAAWLPQFSREVTQLHAAIGDDPRIRLLREPLSYRDVLSLTASADAYVSLHRSEGLGLGPLEAMSLGTLAVATGWSGNTEYMADDTSVLIGYDLVPVDLESPHYGAVGLGQTWAQPRLDEAVAVLRKVAEDPSWREQVAARGRAAAARRAAEVDRAPWWDELVELGRDPDFLERHRMVRARLTSALFSNPADVLAHLSIGVRRRLARANYRARSNAGAVLRAVGLKKPAD